MSRPIARPSVETRAHAQVLRAEIAEQLVVARLEAGLSRSAVAARAHLSWHTYDDLEAGRRAPTLEAIVQAAHVLGLAVFVDLEPL